MKATHRFTILLLIICLQVNVLFSQYVWESYTTDNGISQIVEQGDYMWIASQGSLARCHKESLEVEFFLSSNSPLRGAGIKKIVRQDENVMWFGSYNTGLYRYETGEWQHFPNDPFGNPWEYIINLHYSDGILWFSNQTDTNNQGRGVWSYDGYTFHRQDLTEGHFDFVHDNNGKLVYEDGDNIISLSEGGVRDTLFHKSELPQLAGPSINQLGFTAADNLYFTSRAILSNSDLTDLFIHTENGFIKNSIPSNAVVNFEYQNKLYLNMYYDDSTGDDYYGEVDLEDMSLSLFGLEYLQGMDLGPYNKPTLLNIDSEGRYWYKNYKGPRDNNISVVDGSQIHYVKMSSSNISSNYIDRFSKDCDGNLVAGDYDEVLKFKDNKWDLYFADKWPDADHPSLLITDTVRCIDYGFIDGFLHSISESDTLSLGIDFGHSRSTLIDADGDLYLGDWDLGYCRLSNGELEILDSPWGDLNGIIFEISVDTQGKHWIASGDMGLWTYDGSDFELVNTGLTDHYRVYEDLDGNIWTSQDNILLKYDGDSWSSYLLPEFDMSVSSFVQDNTGAMWIGTWEHGLLRWFDDGQFQLFTTSNSNIIRNNIRKVTIDSKGDLWVATSTGTSRFILSRGIYGDRVDGCVFFDENMDGKKDVGEFPIPYQKIKAEPSGNIIYTGEDGHFTHYPQPSNDASILLEYDPLFTPTTPTNYIVSNLTANATQGNFGLWADNTEPEAIITVIPGTFVCNTTTSFQILVNNEYPGLLKGDLYFRHNSEVEIIPNADSGEVLNDSTLVFRNIEVEAFQYGIYQVKIVVPSEQFVNTVFSFEAQFVNEVTGNVATSTLSEPLLCSYDPNDKTCYPQGETLGNQTLSGSRLNYLIRFQNYGNYKATDIVVVDTLSDLLDISSFRLNHTSHQADLSIDSNNVMKVIFNNIDLPPAEQDSLASQGYISYSIFPKENLELPMLIENTAAIYFDFNEPIITNTTGNEIVLEFYVPDEDNEEENDGVEIEEDLESDEARLPLDFNIFPNPTSGSFYIAEANGKPIDKIEIYNAAGQEVSKTVDVIDANTSEVTLPDLPGIYIIKIFSGDDAVIGKICRTE